MTLPSKELLSEVLGREVKSGKGRITHNGNNITFAYEDEDLWSDINIYELSYRCKEFANNKDYWCDSGYCGHYNGSYYCMLKDMPDNRFYYAVTEIEAIFKACEWILKEEKR